MAKLPNMRPGLETSPDPPTRSTSRASREGAIMVKGMCVTRCLFAQEVKPTKNKEEDLVRMCVQMW